MNDVTNRLKSALDTYSEFSRLRPTGEMDKVKAEILAEFPAEAHLINTIFDRIKQLHDLHLKQLQNPNDEESRDAYNEIGYDTSELLNHTPWVIQARESADETPRKLHAYRMRGKTATRYSYKGDVYNETNGQWHKMTELGKWEPCEPLAVESPAPASAQESTITEEHAQLCPKCGLLQAPDHMKCDDCGTDLVAKEIPAAESDLRCPTCGEKVSSIFDHVDGCPSDHPSDEELAKQQMLPSRKFQDQHLRHSVIKKTPTPGLH